MYVIYCYHHGYLSGIMKNENMDGTGGKRGLEGIVALLRNCRSQRRMSRVDREGQGAGGKVGWVMVEELDCQQWQCWIRMRKRTEGG